jgi:hypothetical protein
VERDESGHVLEFGELTPADIHVGDCLQHLIGESVASVGAVPCDRPHVYEAYAVFNLERAGDYPATRIEDIVTDACWAHWDETFGASLDGDPSLGLSLLFPERAGWEAGDRHVVCLLASIDEGGYLVGTRVPS